MDIANIHKNARLLIDGVPYNVDEADFLKPGKGRAVYRIKLRNMITDTSVERVYHSGDTVEEAPVSTAQMQYLYKEDDRYIFMDKQTFEQYFLNAKQMGSKINLLKEGTTVEAIVMKDTLLGISLPNFIEMKVIKSEAVTKKETVSPQAKVVVLETGATIAVPSFIKEGDILKIDTRTGIYVERVSSGK